MSQEKDYVEFEHVDPDKDGMQVYRGYTVKGKSHQCLDEAGNPSQIELRPYSVTRLYDGDPRIVFMRNHPKINVVFKERNLVKDSEVSRDKRKVRAAALSAASSLSGADIAHMALLCGCYNEVPSMCEDAVLSYAETNPQTFLDIYNRREDADMRVRGDVRKAVAKGFITIQDGHYFFASQHIGSNENSATDFFYTKEAMYDALKEQLGLKQPKKIGRPAADK